MTMKERQPLKGEELKQFELKRQHEIELEKKKEREESVRRNLIEIHDEEEDSDDELQDEMSLSNPRLFLPENMKYHSQHLMFPCIESSYSFDEYGRNINIEELRKIGEKIFEENMEENIEKKEKEEKEKEKYEIPKKVVSREIDVEVNCQIEFVDFEGRSNARSIKNILQQINPRKLILIHGTKEATEELHSYCVEKKIGEQVFSPDEFQPIDVSMDTNMIKVILKEDLLNTIDYISVGLYELSYFFGNLTIENNENKNTQYFISNTSNDIDKKSILNNSHDSIYIGDIKLSNFRDILIKNGFRTEFQRIFYFFKIFFISWMFDL
jgi:cleavage and polyadenylation specificity factor subunit 2